MLTNSFKPLLTVFLNDKINEQPVMAKIAKPVKADTKGTPPRLDSKGEPPSIQQRSSNLSKEDSTRMVLINFNATAEFRKELKIYATELGMTVTDLIMEAIDMHKSSRQ